MPYIPREDRERAAREPKTVGELNYAITDLIATELMAKGLRYHTINAVLGALERARCLLFDPTQSRHGSHLAVDIGNLVMGYAGTDEDKLGALDGAAREFYRRVAGPYEDQAILRNGDAYPPIPVAKAAP